MESSATFEETQIAVLDLLLQYKTSGSVRLQHKVLNDYLVCLVLQIAGHHNKPGKSRRPHLHCSST